MRGRQQGEQGVLVGGLGVCVCMCVVVVAGASERKLHLSSMLVQGGYVNAASNLWIERFVLCNIHGSGFPVVLAMHEHAQTHASIHINHRHTDNTQELL